MPPRKSAEEAVAEREDELTAEQAADDAATRAQEDARTQATERGISLSDAQLDQIGRRAAEETHRLFERAGAFERPEPEPPAPPPEAASPPIDLDEPPKRVKANFAQKICDS